MQLRQTQLEIQSRVQRSSLIYDPNQRQAATDCQNHMQDVRPSLPQLKIKNSPVFTYTSHRE